MKILFYVLAAAAGLFGLLSLFRTGEGLVSGSGLNPVQLGLGVICLLLGGLWVVRARSAK